MTPEEVKHHIKTYDLVLFKLAYLTVLTEAITFQDLS